MTDWFTKDTGAWFASTLNALWNDSIGAWDDSVVTWDAINKDDLWYSDADSGWYTES